MNIMQLRYFLKTAELLNYSRAAGELLIARQSLRQSISALEEEIGKPLFINTKNRLTLTEYGEYLSLAGQNAVKAFDELEHGLAVLTSRSAKIEIGFSSTLAPFILPNTDVFLRAFRSRFPDVEFTAKQMVNDAVIEGVESGKLDAGFVLQMPCSRKQSRMLILRKFDVALDHTDPDAFGGKREVTPEDLRGVSCLGMGSLQTTMTPLWDYCRKESISFPYRIVEDTLDAFYQMKHTGTVGFDILKEDVPGFSWDRTSVLTGFSWETGLLVSDEYYDQNLIAVFFRFMKQQYDNHWALYEKNYAASDTGFNGF